MTPARKRARDLGFDPWQRALEIVQGTTDEAEQFNRLMQVMPYIVPRLRSTEVTGQIDGDMLVRIVLGED